LEVSNSFPTLAFLKNTVKPIRNRFFVLMLLQKFLLVGREPSNHKLDTKLELQSAVLIRNLWIGGRMSRIHNSIHVFCKSPSPRTKPVLSMSTVLMGAENSNFDTTALRCFSGKLFISKSAACPQTVLRQINALAQDSHTYPEP
jgi:hypothetical protein